jgi:hypothetical protein
MTSTTYTFVSGAKGGVGTSTMTALLAVMAGRRQPTFVIDPYGDVAASLGVGAGSSKPLEDDRFVVTFVESLDVAQHLIARHPGEYEVIIDGGTDRKPEDDGIIYTSVLVTGSDFLSLRRLAILFKVKRSDVLVVTTREGSALGVKEAVNVYPTRQAVHFAMTPQTARAIDAGLLAYTVPEIAEHIRSAVFAARAVAK